MPSNHTVSPATDALSVALRVTHDDEDTDPGGDRQTDNGAGSGCAQ